ncbi:hypothetical protein C4K40_2857 [Pseudomonas sp. CMR5c]|nr:hypothetical protein C4K40_2857 [Pseudomonas sp. CMR5c]
MLHLAKDDSRGLMACIFYQSLIDKKRKKCLYPIDKLDVLSRRKLVSNLRFIA